MSSPTQLVGTTGGPTRGSEGEDPEARPRSIRPAWLRRRAWLTPAREVSAECGCRHPFGEIDDSATEVLLDVRDLPMTGRIGVTLSRMEVLPAGKRLRHVNTLIPWPLFAMLETRGYRYRIARRKEGEVHVLIWTLSRTRASS